MTGADAIPPAGEILERFRGDLLKVETRVGQREAVEADTAQTAGRFSDALDSASTRLAEAYDERSHVRGMVIAALEASQTDPDDRETVASIMEVKGKSEEDATDYFAHMGRLGERQQPIVIINGAGALATSSSAVVIFGRTVPGDDHPAVFGEGRWPGSRSVVVPITNKIGFGSSGLDSAGRSGKEMFMGTAEEDGVEDITINPNNHPFEEVHFAASEKEVDRLIAETAEADTREEADQSAMEGFGLPSLVAYGEDAVKAVAGRLAGRSEGHDIFTRRALEELGLYSWDGKSLSAGVEISDEMAENLRLQFSMAVIGCVNDTYSRLSRGDKITGTLAFLAPLQEKIGIDESAVVQELKEIKGRNLEVTRGQSGKYSARTKEGARAIDAMILAAESLAKHGVSVSPTSHELRKAGYDLELRALRDELKFTTPGLEPIRRHRLKRDMRAMQLTALALGVQPRLTPRS